MNREPTTPANQDIPENNLAELSCETNSTSSLHSDHSLDESEDDISYNSGDESQDCIGQRVRVFCLLKNVPD
jgi:hypothetical protein